MEIKYFSVVIFRTHENISSKLWFTCVLENTLCDASNKDTTELNMSSIQHCWFNWFYWQNNTVIYICMPFIKCKVRVIIMYWSTKWVICKSSWGLCCFQRIESYCGGTCSSGPNVWFFYRAATLPCNTAGTRHEIPPHHIIQSPVIVFICWMPRLTLLLLILKSRVDQNEEYPWFTTDGVDVLTNVLPQWLQPN